MGATLSTAAALLKEIYEPKIQEQMYSEAIGLKRIERTADGVGSDNVGGKYVVFAIHTRRNHGIGARNEMEVLPTPGQQGHAAGRVNLKYLYGGVQLSGQVIELADTNAQAFANKLDDEVMGLKRDLVKDQNRQFYGTSVGTLASTVTAGSGVNTFTAVNVQYLEVAMQVDLVDGSTIVNTTPTLKAANRQITAINTTTRVVTLDGATFSPASGDVLVRTGNVNRETTGLSSIIQNSGTLFNIDPTVEPLWKANIDSNGGTNRPLAEGLMINMVDTINAKGGKVSVILANRGVRRAYYNLLQQQRRFTDTKEFEGGFRGLAFATDDGDVPLVVDGDVPSNTMHFLDEKQIKFYRENDWSFMNRDGNMWQRIIGSGGAYDGYEARMYQYTEMGTHRRNAHGTITDITEG
jgi:hypothetical protein